VEVAVSVGRVGSMPGGKVGRAVGVAVTVGVGVAVAVGVGQNSGVGEGVTQGRGSAILTASEIMAAYRRRPGGCRCTPSFENSSGWSAVAAYQSTSIALG
jgi:hypothetical protein